MLNCLIKILKAGTLNLKFMDGLQGVQDTLLYFQKGFWTPKRPRTTVLKKKNFNYPENKLFQYHNFIFNTVY